MNGRHSPIHFGCSVFKYLVDARHLTASNSSSDLGARSADKSLLIMWPDQRSPRHNHERFVPARITITSGFFQWNRFNIISHVRSSASRERGNFDFCRSRDFPPLQVLLDRVTNYEHFLFLCRLICWIMFFVLPCQCGFWSLKSGNISSLAPCFLYFH